MRVTLAQLDPVVGDIQGNAYRLVDVVATAAAQSSDLVVFPELFLVGYPPKDLLERGWFVQQAVDAVQRVREASRAFPHTGILFGAPIPSGSSSGRGRYNAALLVCGGRLLGIARKTLLPVYDVFDEERYFDPAPRVGVLPFKGEALGVHVCEDAWNDHTLWSQRRLYDEDPVAILAEQGATMLVNLSASPFSVGKERVRHALMRGHALKHRMPFLYVNQVGANDELIFDGQSLCFGARGQLLTALPAFREAVSTVDTQVSAAGAAYSPLEEIASTHNALVLGVRDYARKCGFTTAVVGLSGGIDSAVTCAIAAGALGPENVLGVSMPSPYSSQGSLDDARELADNLGISYRVIPIADTFQSYLSTMTDAFSGMEPNVAEENIQARIRGNILMALSNKFGHLVLSTGNKSELSVGYCTLYGDMSGGLAVISDVPKGMVYDLARYMNRGTRIVPQGSIDKPPSAELKPNQVDQDTLPPYLPHPGRYPALLCGGGLFGGRDRAQGAR